MSHITANRIKVYTVTTGTGSFGCSTALTGYRTFSAVMLASGDTCIYGCALNTEWEVGVGTYYTTTDELVRTTVLASSNAGAAVNFSAGSKELYITLAAERLTLPESASSAADPSMPSTGGYMYTRKSGGRWLPRWKGTTGLDSTALQPSLWGSNVTLWLPGAGTTVAIAFGVTWTTSTTQAHPTIANTSFLTQLKRATYTTTTTAANISGVRSAAPICWRGNAAAVGGFFFAARFGIETYQAAMNIFIGLAEKTGAAPASTPDTMSNACGIIKCTSSTLWQVMAHGSIANSYTFISTNVTTRAAGASGIYEFYMFAAPFDSGITFSFKDQATSVWSVTDQTITTTLPLNTIMLTAHAGCQNVAGGAGTACAIFLSKMYIETDN